MMEITKHTFRGSLLQVAWWAIKRELRLRKQHTFTYCPRCNFEMCSMNNAIDEKSGLVYHVCKNCGAGSRWDYDMPAPINVT
jgi:transcription elongation factor Elf1